MCSLTDNYKLYGPFFGNFGSHRVDERTNVSRFNNNVFITREKSIRVLCSPLEFERNVK